MKIPEQLGIMTLPNAVLFPGTLLPLYIFEERYRRMLADCLQGDRMFAIGLAQASQSGPCGVAGVGLVQACVGQPDGTSHLALRGLARVRVRHFEEAHPQLGYPVAAVEPVMTTGACHALNRDAVAGVVRKLARARARLGLKIPKTVVDSVLALENPELFLDLVSYTMLDNWQEKQLMLETLDINERLAQLLALLQKQIERVGTWKKLQGKVLNRHVGNN